MTARKETLVSIEIYPLKPAIQPRRDTIDTGELAAELERGSNPGAS